MNPVEITLASLAGCLSITASFLAKKMKIEIDKLTIAVEGEIDEEAMSSAEKFSGFKEVRYHINFESDSDKEKIEKLYNSIDKRSFPIFKNSKNYPYCHKGKESLNCSCDRRFL